MELLEILVVAIDGFQELLLFDRVTVREVFRVSFESILFAHDQGNVPETVAVRLLVFRDLDSFHDFPRIVVFVVFFVDVKTNFSFLNEEKPLFSNELVDALVRRVNATDEFVGDGNVGLGGEVRQKKETLLDDVDVVGEGGFFAKARTDFFQKGLFFVNVVFFVCSSVVDQELPYLLGCLQRELEAGFESFQDRKVILQIFFFSPQGTQDVADLPVQIHDHNDSEDLH